MRTSAAHRRCAGRGRELLLAVLRRLRSEDRGQSLIIISIAMAAMIGAGALAIDVSSWYVKHHQAQVVADSAALAAANCLANPDTGATTMQTPDGPVASPHCTSSADVEDATKVAVAYAASYGMTIPSSAVNVDTSKGTVSVTATTNAPAFLATIFGIHSTTQTADSTADWKDAPISCTNPGGDCYAIYAASQSCSTVGDNNGAPIGGNGNFEVNGAIHSQGTIQINGNYTLDGPSTYNPGCPAPDVNGVQKGAYAPTPGDEQPADYWPVDYTKVFTSCSATGPVQCASVPEGVKAADGSPDVPSYCTDATTSASGWTFGGSSGQQMVSGHVYCSIGSGNPSDPSTWNGPISDTGNTTATVTLIGGSIDLNGQSTLTAQLDHCLAYVTNGDFYKAGGTTVDGTIFAPNGTITLKGNTAGTQDTAFLEGLYVDTSGTFTGSGPTYAPGGGITGGSDALTQ